MIKITRLNCVEDSMEPGTPTLHLWLPRLGLNLNEAPPFNQRAVTGAFEHDNENF